MNHTVNQLKRALQISEQILALETELAAVFNGPAKPSALAKLAPVAKAKRSGFSAAHRAKLAAAAKARWARAKKGK